MAEDESPLWTPARRALANACAHRWAGTPHANRIAVMGQGIDCIRFIFEVLTTAGICERFTIAAYDGRLGALREINVIEGIITDHFHAESVPGPPVFGDVVIFRCGFTSNHCGVVLEGGDVWHVAGKSRVGPEAWANVLPRLQGLVRFTGTGYKADPSKIAWADIQARKDTTK